jgi:hypothetical protein
MFDYSKESYFLSEANQAVIDRRCVQQHRAKINRIAKRDRAKAEYDAYVKELGADSDRVQAGEDNCYAGTLSVCTLESRAEVIYNDDDRAEPWETINATIDVS